MTRNPLLPHEYTDSGVQAAILYALSPYKINDRSDIVNPALKWNLRQAWADAEELLAKAEWKPLAKEEEAFGLSADSDAEIDALNTMIAGIVAHEIMEPESGIALQRIEHKRGGEMSLVISASVVIKLERLLSPLAGSKHLKGKRKRWWSMLNWIKRIKHGSNG